jgi:hypothetical protein
MPNEMKYQDQTWPSTSSINGEKLSVNGHYRGQHKGTPTQGSGETAANADPYNVQNTIIRYGTITQDAATGSTPTKRWALSYNSNGGSGTLPATQYYNGSALTVAAGSGMTPPIYYEECQSTDTGAIKVVSGTPTTGEIKLTDVSPQKTNSTIVADDYVKVVDYTFSKWNTKADGSGTDKAAAATITPSADTVLYAVWVE